MTTAEKICEKVNKDIYSQAVTLANAVLAMQDKIDQQIPIYEKMPLAQQVKVGTGEKILRQNPAVVEFRATVKDYAAALSALDAILEKKQETAEVSSIEELRKKIKVI